MEKTFKKYNEFIVESLVILSLEGLMKNEFMNANSLRQDFETARRILYEKTGSLFTHIEGGEFTARTFTEMSPDDFDSVLATVNEQTKRIKFKRTKAASKNEIKELVWKIKGEIS